MYHKIFVPLDGSKRAEKILPHVEELASRYKAKVIFLQVVEYKTITTPEGAFINLSDLSSSKLKSRPRSTWKGSMESSGKKTSKAKPTSAMARWWRDHKHGCKRGRGPDCAGQSRPRGSFQSFLRQCCRRAAASGRPPAVDYQIPGFGVIREN